MASAAVATQRESIPFNNAHPGLAPLPLDDHQANNEHNLMPGQQEIQHHYVPSSQPLKRDADGFLHRSVQDLFSLARRTVVITGGARGIGLAFAFAVAEAGGNVAILDISDDPHPHFLELMKRFPEQKFKLYRCVPLSSYL